VPFGEVFVRIHFRFIALLIADYLAYLGEVAVGCPDITKRWRLVAWLWRVMLDWLFSVLIKMGRPNISCLL